MRVRLLVIWITLTALLQWSRAQEDNIQDIGLSGGVESPDPDEEKPPEIKEDIFTSPTTDMPGVEPVTDAPMDQDHHQSEEDKQEEPVGFGMGTQDMPSDGSQISVMSAEETTTGSTLPPPTVEPINQEPSSSEADILKKPPTSPVKVTVSGLPDYQDDTPFENNSLPVETTTTASTAAPVNRPQSCYSCLNCNATITDDQKTICKTVPGDHSGCYTMLVKDKNLLPNKMSYVERGCTAELTEVFFTYCSHNKELCKKCDSNYCNVHDMTSLQVTTAGATSARLFESLLAGSICWVSWWRRQVFY
ncbi:hypothetical protein KR032_002031 [Drosophila birchii]|nr:hypothetical protein KR032_002031 [Drosophila birchii]